LKKEAARNKKRHDTYTASVRILWSTSLIVIIFCLAPLNNWPLDEYKEFKEWFLNMQNDKDDNRWNDYCKVTYDDIDITEVWVSTDLWEQANAFTAGIELNRTNSVSSYHFIIPQLFPALIYYFLTKLIGTLTLAPKGNHYYVSKWLEKLHKLIDDQVWQRNKS
jgi:hypothetical protein